MSEMNNEKTLRRIRWSVIAILAVILACICVFILTLDGRPIEALLRRGSAYFIGLALFVALAISFVILEIRDYKSIKKAKLAETERTTTKKSFRGVFSIAIAFAFFLTISGIGIVPRTGEIIEIPDELNFPTVYEVFPQKEFVHVHGNIRPRSNIIAPNVQYFFQSGWVSGAGGVNVTFVYEVDYYEFRFERLAVLYERELRRHIGESRAVNVVITEIANKMEKDIQGFDSVVYFSYFSFRACWPAPAGHECECGLKPEHHQLSENLIMRAGNTVIYIRYQGPESLLDSVNQGRFVR